MKIEIKVGTVLIAKDYFHMEGSGSIFAVKGKEYPVISVIGRTLYITDEKGDLHGFDKDDFEGSSFRKWFTVKGESTPSHSEEAETTERAPFYLPLKVVDGQIRDAFGDNIISRFPFTTKLPERQYIVTAVNSYAALKAENERLKATLVSERQMRSDMQMEFKTDRANLQSDNEAKDKRIAELTRLLEKAYYSIYSGGYQIVKDEINKTLNKKP